jgi:hypothetical protein
LAWNTSSAGWYASLFTGATRFTTPKRAAPSLAYWDGAGNPNKVTNLNGSSNVAVVAGSPVVGAGPNGFYADINVALNSAVVFVYWEASAEL